MTRQPAFFFGHGNPMNTLPGNPWAEAWQRIGGSLPAPRAVLAVSAHWYVPFTAVTSMERPRTIHDFGGFPEELYRIRYPAPGDPALARRICSMLAPLSVKEDLEWGLDHGTWSVLRHIFPGADVPVVQLSMDAAMPPDFHLELGRRLAPLREEGILPLGSGNVVHNLHAYSWGSRPVAPFDWAARFEEKARELILGRKTLDLAEYRRLGRDALLSVPTPEHYLPLLYILGMGSPEEEISFPVEGIEGGSVSMLAVQIGKTAKEGIA